MSADTTLPMISPDTVVPEAFTDAKAAVAKLIALYDEATQFLCAAFSETLATGQPASRYRAFYPEVRIRTTSFAVIDSRLSYGHVAQPGSYSATITRPHLFEKYLEQQISLLIQNHKLPVEIGVSMTPMPVHFAVANQEGASVPQEGAGEFTLRDVFDVPDLATTNDDIVNGLGFTFEDGSHPLAPFTAQRVDYSLARLSHYTATSPEHFQNHVLFTNYQFYVEEFEAYARQMLADKDSGYTSFVATGNVEIT
ncbi:MAG: AMP nucleosidase, partial [Paracoccaceae bacterium]